MTRPYGRGRLRPVRARPQRWDSTGLRRRRRAVDPRHYLRGVIVAALLGLAVLPSVGDAIDAALKPGLGGMFGGGSPDVGCRVPSVIDGDTVTLWCPGQSPVRARLVGFDTPELFSPNCAWEAQQALKAKWRLRLLIWDADDLLVVRKGRDRYGRALVALGLDGVPVARSMIETGLARPYHGGRRAGWCDGRGILPAFGAAWLRAG